MHSPFHRIPLLHAIAKTLRAINPVLFGLGAFAALVLASQSLFGSRRPPFAALACAFCALYLTAVHVILQAEPRYSIPYRPMQMLLVATTLRWGVEWLRRRRAPAPAAGAADDRDAGRAPR
jgi:hypothetical protein